MHKGILQKDAKVPMQNSTLQEIFVQAPKTDLLELDFVHHYKTDEDSKIKRKKNQTNIHYTYILIEGEDL